MRHIIGSLALCGLLWVDVSLLVNHESTLPTSNDEIAEVINSHESELIIQQSIRNIDEAMSGKR